MSPPWNRRCPRGHASVDVFVNRFRCAACARRDVATSYPIDELVTYEVS